ncbi:MAG TPA: hypothetical protein VF982_00960 [Anaerolineales bacterium]
MGMVAPRQRIASAYFVIFGLHGQVTQYAEERGVCRQWVYREAEWVRKRLGEDQQTIQSLRQQVRELTAHQEVLEKRLDVAVVLDKEKQVEFATACQGEGVSLPTCWRLLDVFIPGQQQSVATLGRATQAAGKQAGPLLAVLDEFTHARVQDTAADELHVKDPVLMMVEQESLCWLVGRRSDEVSGEAWHREFERFPNLEQVARDGGKGLEKGVALVNAQRVAEGKPAVVDKGDHFHALRGGGTGLGKAQLQASKALAAADKVQKEVAECQRQGQSLSAVTARARHAWRKAEEAMDAWCAQERLWHKVKEAMQLVTPAGELNARPQAEAILAETLPQLPDSFAKPKRQVQKPEMLNYLDHVHQQIQELPFAEEVKQAAVRQEALRRKPQALQGESQQAAARRGLLLMCAVILGKVGEPGTQAVAAVREIFRKAYRASSLVECLNSAIRMHQNRHRKMTQGLLDLKRLYWNCHTFRTGRRRGTTPYHRLGVPWPEGVRWWEVLKLTPEQLRDKLSTAKKGK